MYSFVGYVTSINFFWRVFLPTSQEPKGKKLCLRLFTPTFSTLETQLDYMDVSENRGTLKSSILIGFSMGYPYFWKLNYIIFNKKQIFTKPARIVASYTLVFTKTPGWNRTPRTESMHGSYWERGSSTDPNVDLISLEYYWMIFGANPSPFLTIPHHSSPCLTMPHHSSPFAPCTSHRHGPNVLPHAWPWRLLKPVFGLKCGWL